MWCTELTLCGRLLPTRLKHYAFESLIFDKTDRNTQENRKATRLMTTSIPDNTTVFITRSTPPHINTLIQGDCVVGKFCIENFGVFSFSVECFGTPNAPINISSEDEQDPILSVHFGFDPQLLESPTNQFIYRCFLTAWNAKRGHPSGYLDKPVPFPLPPDLRQEVSGE